MKTNTLWLGILIALLIAVIPAMAETAPAPAEPTTTAVVVIPEGNVWTTADGEKFFTCPVMGGEGEVTRASGYSDIAGVRYYHCCASCIAPFRSNSAKWLKELVLPANIEIVDEDGNKLFKDPVDGKILPVQDETDYLDKDGKRWYFASKANLTKFQTPAN